MIQQRSRVKDLFSLAGYDDSCLAAMRDVKSIILVIQLRLNIRSRSVLFLLFPTFVLFPIECFLYTLLPSPRDKLEFLGQILIK